MKSKYLNSIKLKDDLFAVYNSLLCVPIYMTKKEKESVFSEDLNNFSEDEINELYKHGILIKDKNIDKNAVEILRKSISKGIDNKISLMYLIPTNTCNLACKYCFIGNTVDKKCQTNMKWETAQIAIDKFYEHLKKNKIKKGAIICYGAEPTINWDLVKKAAQYVIDKDYNITVDIVTNATLITDEIADDIKRLNIGVGISIDGPREVTDKNRIFKVGNKSVYEAVENAIEIFKRKEVFFSLSVTISDYFIENSKYILKWLINLNVPSINFNLMHYTDPNTEWKQYYKKASEFLIKAYTELKKNNIQDDRVFRKVESFYDRKFKFSDCGAMGGTQITIRPNGDMCICHGYWNQKEHYCGNIIRDNIEDVFKTEEYKFWNKNITLNKPECLKCKYIFTCGGGCAQQSENLFGNIGGIDKSFCKYTKIAFKWLLLNHYNQK